MDMNVVNTILIILIIIIVINHLTNNKIIKNISNLLHSVKGKDNNKVYDINNVFRKISSNMNIKNHFDFNQPLYASRQMIKILGHKLSKLLNHSMKKYNYKCRDLIMNNNVVYYKSQIGKYFKPFFVIAKIDNKQKKTAKLSLKIELFVKQNTNDMIIISISKEKHNYSDVLTDNPIQPDIVQEGREVKLPNEQNKPEQYNSLFLKNTQQYDDNSSLIPSVINITPVDTACETQSACESTCNTITNTATNTATNTE